MMAQVNNQGKPRSEDLKIAIEGCGHGTLDAIYASVQKSCEIKGWDGVDLVIIGGDFQAVRNKHDLNVTAMPTKYRAMADFHQYYSGTKVAPYLTVFVGGNHEASNHLFELYYGGWVAPNIYYLGAANVIQFGPLKIAGLSGIWKGYDYRKQHHERLPYNKDDMYSIYHVRELDVRKLLAFRSQVDIGISHDWPNGIEWLGDAEKLFRHKQYLRQDAESGRLGNIAAKQVMDRLRPPYWFSAHLHSKYAAVKSYADDSPDQIRQSKVNQQEAKAPPQHVAQLSAWNNFGAIARKEEAEATVRALQEEKMRREEAARRGVPLTANYVVNETYKKVRLGNGITRDVTSVSYSETNPKTQEEQHNIPQLDGSCFSLPLKRSREQSSLPQSNKYPNVQYTPIQDQDATPLESLQPVTIENSNPDAIDIEMSDDEEVQPTANQTEEEQTTKTVGHSVLSSAEETSAEGENISAEHIEHAAGSVNTGGDDHQHSTAASLTTAGSNDLMDVQDHERSSAAEDVRNDAFHGSDDLTTSNDVSEDMRAQLAALSSKFDEPVKVSPPLPHPEHITNKTTKFLALSKCEDKQNFLQLLQVQPYAPSDNRTEQPLRLSYVPEWLAILRVFAPELTLGGNPAALAPRHKGDTYYRERILEEEKWVEENIVNAGKLDVHENFVKTAAIYDPQLVVDENEMPREVTNPQTSAFCKLIGIDNPFDISEEERDARMAAGPAQSANTGHRGGRAGGRGGPSGNRGGGFSRGGRGYPNFGGRGRGRGRN